MKKVFFALAAMVVVLCSCCDKKCDRKTDDGKLPFRLSLNVSTIQAYNLSVPEQINAVADAGFDGIELWIRDVYRYIDEGGSVDSIARLIRERGLVLENLIGHATWLSSDPKTHQEGLEAMKQDLELAAKLGSRCMAATGKGLTGWELADIPEYGRQYAEILDYGRALGVRPIVELWGHRIMSRVWQVEAVALESGRSDAGLLLDFYHLYRGGNSFASLALLDISQMPVIHLNDYPGAPAYNELTDADRTFPGEGICPYGEILPMLVAKGFDGALSLELFNESYWNHYATAPELLKVAHRKCLAAIDKALGRE
ncbi:xylose isomerase [Bacteroidia bacterium]|nr:xylose isomerase [Bacteroidia bacterium]